MYPGIEPILGALGVWTRVRQAGCFHRHCGIWNEIGGRRWFIPYGRDAAGPWLGLQADRRVLHTLLHEAVVETGARRLALPEEWQSPPLRLRFGGCRTSAPELDGQPLFRQSDAGWTWHAPVTDRRLAWVQLQVDPSAEVERTYAWRLHGRAAGPGYFVLGDAAALLDAAASNGVLRAMMSSGIFAAHLAHAVAEARISEATATELYIKWIEGMFLDSAAELRRRLPHAAPREPAYSP